MTTGVTALADIVTRMGECRHRNGAFDPVPLSDEHAQAVGTAITLFRRIYDAGCPTYRSNDASRTRNDCLCCQYCDANLEQTGDPDPHADDCLWRALERYLWTVQV